MAKDNKGDTVTTTATPPAGETVTMPADLLRQMEARLEALERAEFARQELLRNPNVKILDQTYEDWKREASRTAQERSQDVADRTYGTDGPRFRLQIVGVPQAGGKTPDTSEHPTLVVSGHSDLEAQARYLKLCGITTIRGEYAKLTCEPVATTQAA